MKQKDIRSILRDMYLGEAYRPDEVERALTNLRSLIQAEKIPVQKTGDFKVDIMLENQTNLYNSALDRVLEMIR